MTLIKDFKGNLPASNVSSQRKVALHERLSNLTHALSGNLNFTVDEELISTYNVFFRERDAIAGDEKILAAMERLARHVGNDNNADIIREKRERLETKKSSAIKKNNIKLEALMPERLRTEIQDLANDPQLQDDEYLKYVYAFQSRFTVALNNYRRIRSLEKSTVLDIGTGMGYLPYILERNGHSTVCIDVPNTKIFDKSCDLLGIKKVEFKIEKYKKLMDFKVKFDTVNASLICFNNHKTVDLWKKEEWLFFLCDLHENHLNEKGVVHLGFNRENDDPNNFLGCQALHKFFDPFMISEGNAAITKNQIADLLNK